MIGARFRTFWHPNTERMIARNSASRYSGPIRSLRRSIAAPGCATGAWLFLRPLSCATWRRSDQFMRRRSGTAPQCPSAPTPSPNCMGGLLPGIHPSTTGAPPTPGRVEPLFHFASGVTFRSVARESAWKLLISFNRGVERPKSRLEDQSFARGDFKICTH
jgi:hypothetical protein